MNRGSRAQPIPDLEVYRFTGCEKYEVNADISFIVAVRGTSFQKEKRSLLYVRLPRGPLSVCRLTIIAIPNGRFQPANNLCIIPATEGF